MQANNISRPSLCLAFGENSRIAEEPCPNFVIININREKEKSETERKDYYQLRVVKGMPDTK